MTIPTTQHPHPAEQARARDLFAIALASANYDVLTQEHRPPVVTQALADALRVVYGERMARLPIHLSAFTPFTGAVDALVVNIGSVPGVVTRYLAHQPPPPMALGMERAWAVSTDNLFRNLAQVFDARPVEGG